MVEATRETYYTAYHYKRQVHWGTKRKHMGNPIKQLVHRMYKRQTAKGLTRPDRLQEREAAKRYMDSCVQFGMVGLYVQQRDCDHYWYETVELRKPVFTALRHCIDQYRMHAEGPCYPRIVSPREAVQLRRGTRGS